MGRAAQQEDGFRLVCMTPNVPGNGTEPVRLSEAAPASTAQNRFMGLRVARLS